MPNAYYTCNLLPLELVVRAGYSPRWLGEHLQDPGATARRDALSIHPMTCPYVTSLVAAADALFDGGPGEDVLLVPGGCDAMRRMGDLLAATYPGRVFVLPLGRSSQEGVVRTLASDLAGLERWLEQKAASRRLAKLPDFTGREPPARLGVESGPAPGSGRSQGAGVEGGPTSRLQVDARARAEIEAQTGTTKQTPRVDYPSPPRPGGVFVVAGPLTDDSLLRLIGQLGAWVSGLESCTSPDRWRPLAAAGAAREAIPDPPPGAGAAPAADAATAPPDDYHAALAREILAAGMCPRRSTVERRDYLVRRLEASRPSSIIYARQSFCDPGAYDALLVAQLAEERGLPYLEIEVGFPFEASGPLRTRVEAFLEAQMLDDDLLDDLLDLDGLEPGGLPDDLDEEV
jgi:hypothetical protein